MANIQNVNPSSILEKLNWLSYEFGRDNVADLCVAYARSLNFVDGCIIGMETSQQLNENIKLFSNPLLDDEQLIILNRAFLGLPEKLLNPALW